MATKSERNGAILREYRDMAGITQTHVGKACGVSASTVCRWESGKANPAPWKRSRLKVLFGILSNAFGWLED